MSDSWDTSKRLTGGTEEAYDDHESAWVGFVVSV